jgi:hypothetical protein
MYGEKRRHMACHSTPEYAFPLGCAMPQRIRDYGVAALALVVVLAALVGLDDRVPAHLRQAMSDVASGAWTAPGSPIGNVMMSVAASPAVDNAFVAALLVSAAVLLFLMVRTQ